MFALSFLLPVVLGWGIYEIFSGSGSSDDSVTGGSGNDFVFGNAGNDTVMGFSGDDVVYGGAGSDEVMGNDGNDTIYGSWNPDGTDRDAAYQAAYNAAKADPTLANATDAEILVSKYFNGVDTSASYLSTGLGRDDGASIGYDNLFGGNGNDVIYMGHGDTAFGDADPEGNAYDGPGADEFHVVQSNAVIEDPQRTIIYDFEIGTDSLYIHYSGASSPAIEIQSVVNNSDPNAANDAIVLVDGQEFVRLKELGPQSANITYSLIAQT